jgi:hypothetical protein
MMSGAIKFNDFAAKHGASLLHVDENLILQKEIREEVVFWGSVYDSDFVEMPDSAFTSEAAYRTWCWKTTGIMPEKRASPREFDKYIRTKMIEATTREVLPGTEYGAEVESVIEEILLFNLKWIVSRPEGCDWKEGDWVWIETIDESRGEEIIIRIKPFMQKINIWEARGNTEGKIKRRDVCKRLVHYGRKVDDREGSVNRLRSAYALPEAFREGGFEALKKK